MKQLPGLLPQLLLASLVLISCHKSTSENDGSTGIGSDPSGTPIRSDAPSPQSVPYPLTSQNACTIFPAYGDTILYPQTNGNVDYIVAPVNNPGTGKYVSWPMGLSINATTGAIDVTKSETGMRYAIGFIQSTTGDTCISNIVIAGSSYLDSVYVADNGATRAVPYFDASLSTASPCSGNGCSFDITGSAAAQKVIVQKFTGAIDLQKTLLGDGIHGGAFGWFPYNGQTVTTTMYYRLNDPSNNALQQITIQLVYYDSKSSIPASLLTDFTDEYNNLISGKILSSTYNPRPPLVVIVRVL